MSSNGDKFKWRIVIHQSRYGGVYEGAQWFAIFCGDTFPDRSIGDDVECSDFWGPEESKTCGIGDTPNDALDDLFSKNIEASLLYENIYGIRDSPAKREAGWLVKLKLFVARLTIREFP